MNPYLPNAPYAADAAMLGLPISTPMTGNPSEGNVLLASVRDYRRVPLCCLSQPPCSMCRHPDKQAEGGVDLFRCCDRPCCALQIENMAYPVTVDAIHTVFSPYGFVQKIAIFERNNGWQVRGIDEVPKDRHGVMSKVSRRIRDSWLWDTGTRTVSRTSQRQQREAGVGGPRNL